jgi:bifunctional DNA-binding transcriptional regulator/antitoxin component of YhaV-PrlF toxin-antitoxin module
MLYGDPGDAGGVAAQKFRTRLERPGGVGAWTFALVPRPVANRLSLRARMRVAGTIDGASFRSSLIPRGDGRLFVVVPSALRERIGKSSGQAVELAVAPDHRPVVLRLPKDFRKALGSARTVFERLAPSHRKAYVQWITAAKQAATRARRIAKAVEMVRHGRTLN